MVVEVEVVVLDVVVDVVLELVVGLVVEELLLDVVVSVVAFAQSAAPRLETFAVPSSRLPLSAVSTLPGRFATICRRLSDAAAVSAQSPAATAESTRSSAPLIELAWLVLRRPLDCELPQPAGRAMQATAARVRTGAVRTRRTCTDARRRGGADPPLTLGGRPLGWPPGRKRCRIPRACIRLAPRQGRAASKRRAGRCHEAARPIRG